MWDNLKKTERLKMRIPTKYPGISYKERRRIGGRPGETERAYFARYRDKDTGKQKEKMVGRQYKDDMTPARAYKKRLELIEKKDVIIDKKAHLDTLFNLWSDNFNPRKSKRRKEQKDFPNEARRYNNHIKPYFEKKNIPPSNITSDIIDHFHVFLVDKGYKAATIVHILRILRDILKKGSIEPQFNLPQIDNEKDSKLSDQEINRVLYNCCTRLQHRQNNVSAIILMALCTGMRRSELVKLQWEDVDFDYGFIKIMRPKSQRKFEMIPVNSSVKKVLQRLPRTSTFCFPNAKNGLRDVGYVSRFARKILDECCISKNIDPIHGLRHAYASRLASSGKVSMNILQQLLTHKDISTTMRYAHLANDTLKKAAEIGSF